MTPLQTAALIVTLVEALKEKGSWCGETHVQKATYLLETLRQVPLGLDFVLYKHGPYSFELSDRLEQMRGMSILRLTPQPYPYGPSLAVCEAAKSLRKMYARTADRYNEDVRCIAKTVDAKGVTELERLTTAVYVIKELGEAGTKEQCVTQLRRYKPHIDLIAAENAIDAARTLTKQARV